MNWSGFSWTIARTRQRVGSVQINLDAVSFVDAKGRSMLAALRRLGCELKGCGPFISAVIEEVSSDPAC